MTILPGMPVKIYACLTHLVSSFRHEPLKCVVLLKPYKCCRWQGTTPDMTTLYLAAMDTLYQVQIPSLCM